MKVEWDDQEAWRKCWIFATLRLRGRPDASALWDCFWGRIFNKAANLSPKQCHNTLDNHLDPVSRATSKWRTATPLLAAAEVDALGTEWSLHWNLLIPVACSESLTFLPTVQVETGLWGWTINKDSFYFPFHCKRACQQFQAVYVMKMFGMTP